MQLKMRSTYCRMAPAFREGLWGKKNPGQGRTEDYMKIEENSMIRTTKVLSGEVEKTGDVGETAGLLDISPDFADIFLKSLNAHSSRWG
jgi:hypothetical protein